MSKWEMVRLGDVCTFINGDRGKNYPSATDFVNTGIAFINAGHLENKRVSFGNMNYITERKFNLLGSGKIQIGDVLYCLRGSLGKHAMVLEDIKGAIASSLVILRPHSIFPNYLMYCLDSSLILKQQNKVNTGSSQPNLSASSVKGYKIPLPPIDIQKQIAAILDNTTELIKLRKQQLAELDNLIKSVFYDIFGDPVVNDKGWETVKLGELGKLARGISKHRPRNDSILLGGQYPLIQTSDVANADLFINDYKQTYSEVGLLQSKMWPKGTLCITIAANIAKTAVLNFDSCFPDSVVGFAANKRTNIFFIHNWFGFFQKILEEQAPESAQKNINLRILNELDVICPPYELQNHYAIIVEEVEEQKADVKKLIKESQLLFDSFMSRYFE